jgi:transcriptional regulator with XRE-family HTH domain
MKLDEKLHKQMLLKGLNGQRLARLSQVSDSEISRILSGKSLPGLENAFRLAKAVGVSLDYLADDSLESDPGKSVEPTDVTTEVERSLLKSAREIGPRQVSLLLEMVSFIGYEVTMSRILNARPVIEPTPIEAARAPQSNGNAARVTSA